VVPAKIIARQGRVYFRKRCPTHGEREDFVCSDARRYDRSEFSVPGKIPAVFGTDVAEGCPKDCGLCPDHEQHTCIGLVEITSNCNLECPTCYASSGPRGAHLPAATVRRMIDRLVEVEGGAEVLQLSGGEPTTHPEFAEILKYACAQRIDLVMINSNGLRFALDPSLVDLVARFRSRLEVYLQFDTFDDDVYLALRGARLLEKKITAVEALGAAGVRVILVSTLQAGLNDHELGAIVRFGLERPWVTGVSLQPATYCGRHDPPALERRVTFPDVVQAIAAQTDGIFTEADFIPLPCAHPNCHWLTYAFRYQGRAIPLPRFIDPHAHVDLLANGITYTRARARRLVAEYLAKTGCAASSAEAEARGGCDSVGTYLARLSMTGRATPQEAPLPAELAAPAAEFFRRALAEQLTPADVFRITITSFLDAYNFDTRRVQKCCIHHVLPEGHVVPFCSYNVLYRDGHLRLPPLARPPAKGGGHDRVFAPGQAPTPVPPATAAPLEARPHVTTDRLRGDHRVPSRVVSPVPQATERAKVEATEATGVAVTPAMGAEASAQPSRAD
jgi:uncharacterized radical SAM superfamily Fe-S cluster-containing enzyme